MDNVVGYVTKLTCDSCVDADICKHLNGYPFADCDRYEPMYDRAAKMAHIGDYVERLCAMARAHKAHP